MPTILDVSMYLFLSSMTTVSAVIFLYGPTTKVASVTAIHLAESGESAAAAAMVMLVVYACIVVRIAHAFVSGWLLKRVQV
jgi:iron(III) transport system permease protein